MFLRRGNFTHDANDATVRRRIVPTWTDDGILIGSKEFWGIRGRLLADDATALSAKVVLLKAAYAATGGDIVLLQNDGTTETDFKITGNKTIGGIRATRLEFPSEMGASWTTFLDYEIDIVATLGVTVGGGTPGGGTIISWTESISFRGTGGPRFAVRECRNAIPQVQQVSKSTPIYANQRGVAVGLSDWPDPPRAVWPQHEIDADHEEAYTGADAVGSGQGGATREREFRTSWSYKFKASQPIRGKPRVGF